MPVRLYQKKLFKLNSNLTQSRFYDKSHLPQKIRWKLENAARNLNKKLQATIIGRSRKQKLSYGNDYVIETYKSFKSKYTLRLYEQCFSQTNPETVKRC